jgi:prevent-host-death family protein
MKSVNIHDAKTHLSRYVKEARAGESLIICDRNVPVAELRPYNTAGKGDKVVQLGALEGKVQLDDAAFAPMTDEEVDEWLAGGDLSV